MEDISVFTDKEIVPSENELADWLGDTFHLWGHIVDFVIKKYPAGIKQWNYSGKKYGWNFRIKDNKRAIVYLLPRKGYFKVAFVFGEKASEAVWASDISESIKRDLADAIKYAEGRGIRIDVGDEHLMDDIKRLIEIKLG